MILIKIGGGKNINISAISEDVAMLLKQGNQVILVHGANVTRDEIAQKLGVPTKTITSPSGVVSVYTDTNAIDVFLMSYCGLLNKKIVVALQRCGVNAVGISGIDGKLWEAKRKEAIYAVENGKTKLIKDNMTGKVERINIKLVQLLLENNFVPVICPPAISFDNEIVNTDGDNASVALAETLDVEKIVFLFEAPGLLEDYTDNASVIRSIDKNYIQDFLQFANGRMKKKILAAQKALENGVQQIFFGDGRIEHPLLNALSGGGTIIS